MPSWADGDEDGRQAEWAGVGRHRLARHQPKAAQAGPSLPPRIIEGHPDRIVCSSCGRDEPWPDWWTAGGVDGPPRCPGCNETERENE